MIQTLFYSCNKNTLDNGYRIEIVDIQITNLRMDNIAGGVASEGTKNIDVDCDGVDDLGLGLGYFRKDNVLKSYYFGIDLLREDVFIASSEYIDTIYECKPTQGSPFSKTTTYNSLSPFVCDESAYLLEKEIKPELYPTIFNSNDIESSLFDWTNQKLTMSRCEKNSNSFGILSTSIVHDFWVNQTAKYIFFELRDKKVRKGFLKLDSDDTGSYHIYEIGLEDI